MAAESQAQDPLIEPVGGCLGLPAVDEGLGGGGGVLGRAGGVGGDLGGAAAALAVGLEVLDDLAASGGEGVDGCGGDARDVGDPVVDWPPADTEAGGQLPAQLGFVEVA